MGWGREAVAWAGVAVAAGFGNFLLGCYCGTYGGGRPVPPTRVYELEPNGTPETATIIGLAPRDFEGDCAADGAEEDWFRVAVTMSGYVFVEIAWDDDDYDIDLAVLGSGYAFGDTAVPPGDTPIQVEGHATTSGAMFLQVLCKETSVNPVHYLGHVDAP